MAEIFVSHHGGDRVAVDNLCAQLERNGYGPDQVFVDRTAPDGVGALAPHLAARIRESKLVIFCVSDAALSRPWFVDERAMAYATNSERGAIFVQVGALNREADFRGPFLEAASRFPIDLTELANPALPAPGPNYKKLVDSVALRLGLPPPLVVKGAILAMSDERFKTFTEKLSLGPKGVQRRWAALEAICGAVGMTAEGTPPLREQLAHRYGPTPDAFAPFTTSAQKKPALKDLVNDALKHANQYRSQRGLARIHIHWIHQALLSDDDDDARQAAQAEWRTEHSVAFIDSLSALDPQFSQRVDSLLSDPDQSDSSVVWIPPHTQRLAEVGKHARVTAAAVDRLTLWFKRLDERLDPSFAFDIADPTEMQQWMHQLLRSLSKHDDAAPAPSLARTQSMQLSNPPPDLPGLPWMGSRGTSQPR